MIAENSLFIFQSSGSLVTRHSASSDYGWTRRPPDMKVPANILNKQMRKADKGRSSSLGVGRGPETPHRKKTSMLRNIAHYIGLDLSLGTGGGLL